MIRCHSIAFVTSLFLVSMVAETLCKGEDRSAAFTFASPERTLVFPRDHGSHPDFKIEWWYLTGHLFSEGDRRFGFEATFFRIAQRPETSTDSEAFSNTQIYMAHLAVSDIKNGRFLHEERLNREGWDAFAKTGDLDVRNGNWRLKRSPENELNLEGSIRSEARLALRCVPVKEHVLFGEKGYSKKGDSPGSASHYITWTRLQTSGTIRLDGIDYPVRGTAWLDHEFSSSQLDEDQEGWDWVSIQFHDGREIMAYVLRLKDGTYSPHSRLTWIGRDGKLVSHDQATYTWEAGGFWTSPETKAVYPVRPQIQAIDPESGKKRHFRIVPLMENQEIPGALGGVPYWEGACDVLDETGKIVGHAYLELAGYVSGLGQRLR